MRYRLPAFCIGLLFSFSAFSQKSQLSGVILDSFEKKNLGDAVVSLVNKKDSTLYRFVRTKTDGSFSFQSLDTGNFYLYIHYPKYVDHVEDIRLGAGEMLNLGSIPVIPASKLLEEVIVKQNRAIRMRGDTIEYTADSFKVRDGASVKDLLRVMPGLQVDNKGQVTAQGQKVEKVLVDGEEFFGDDPAVVIENLRADAIDKVQSFDKKSEQAEFTGVDDGSRSKTLNLVLKEDKKKGYFGKVVIGGGTEERYSEEAMLNFFKGKKKFSVYGIASNTGKTGLGWQDRNKFGEGDDFGDATVEMGAGFIMISSDGDDDFGDWSNRYYDEGIPRTFKAGAHYSNKWLKDQQNMNLNYTIRDIKNEAIGNSLTKYILPDSAYYSRENHKSGSQETRQLASGLYDIKIDSLASIRFKLNAKKERKTGATLSNTLSQDEDLNLVNDNKIDNSSESTNEAYLASLLWRQKFTKKGRTLSLSLSHKYNEGNSTGFLFSTTDFYSGSANPYLRDTVDQFKSNFSKTLTTNSKLVYTEPAGKKALVEFNYAFSRIGSDADRRSFDKVNGKYTGLNQEFSNKYSLNYHSNSAGFKYQYNGKKLVANIGTNLGLARYEQFDSLGKKVNDLKYTNLFPTSRITYKMAAQRSLNLTYSGSPQPPSLDQVNPIRENTNSLFIQEGNPDLEQAFRHSVSLFFSDFKLLTGRNIWINGSFSSTNNAIVSSQVTVNGVTTQKYINTNGNFDYYFYSSYGFKLKKTELNLGVNLQTNGGRFVNFVNGISNTSNNNTTGLSFSVYTYKEDKYDFNANVGYNLNTSQSSINPNKLSFWSQDHNASVNVYITKRLRIGSDVNFYLREKTDAFDGNNNFTVWGATLNYQVFKKKNGEFRLEMNDILNQRRGFEREFTLNRVYERNFNQLGRYGMLSFVWNFTKQPGTTK
ncbi:MAG: outer membrane beta-barrel protein [Chitinophagales bacterium]|nr:outer membrane beta-barrel protein [Chitinophagales bacterium]